MTVQQYLLNTARGQGRLGAVKDSLAAMTKALRGPKKTAGPTSNGQRSTKHRAA